jgi:PKD repeat protein
LIQGNVFENSWVDGQVGYGVSIKSSNQDGTAPWSQTSDVTFTENIIRHVAIGIQVAARDNINTTQVTNRVLIRNNLFEDVNSLSSGGSGTMVRIIGGNAPAGYVNTGPTYVTLDHNTGFVTSNSSGKMLEVSDVTPSFVFTNNLFDYNSYAVKGSGLADGSNTLNVQFPGVTFMGNAMTGNSSGSSNFSGYPGNYFPTNWSSVQFINFNNGLNGDYHLALSSPLRNMGSDGRDLGADIDALNAAVNALPANQPPTVALAASPISGMAPLAVTFDQTANDPDGFISTYNWEFGDGDTSSGSSPSHVYQSAGTFTARVTVTDNNGASASSLVTITVASPSAPPQVTLLTPNTRITLKAKSTYNITWEASSSIKMQSHSIDLSIDGGNSWQNVVRNLRGMWTSYSWRVPNQPTSNALIRVTTTNGAGVFAQDVSDTSFIIVR